MATALNAVQNILSMTGSCELRSTRMSTKPPMMNMRGSAKLQPKLKIAEEERKETRLVLIFGVALFVFLFSVMLLATIKTSSESAQPVNQAVSMENSSTITLLHSSDEYVDEEWEPVQKDLASRGFTNIVITVEKNSKDLGTVASVTIDGKNFKAGDTFPADAEVVIKYRAEKLFN